MGVARVSNHNGTGSVVELQRGLRLLGWPIRVDGVYGGRTADAVREFQRGFAYATLVASGRAGPKTYAALRASIRRGCRCSQHFNFRMFRSKGDGWIKLDRALVRGLEEYRNALGAPVAIVSGYRDPRHHAAVGGVARSEHLQGCAADVEALLTIDEVIELRVFSGIGYDGDSGLVHHVDIRHLGPNLTGGTVANPTIWAGDRLGQDQRPAARR